MDADEAGPFDSPMPTATATSGRRKAAYFQEASTNPIAGEADGGQQEAEPHHLPATEAGREPRHERRDRHQTDGGRQGGQAGLQRA